MYDSINNRTPSIHKGAYLHEVYMTPFNYIVITVAKCYFALAYFNGTLKVNKIIIV